MIVYFSHTGNSKYLPEIEINNVGTLENIVDEINKNEKISGIKNAIFDNGSIASNVRIFKNVHLQDELAESILVRKYYELEETEELTNPTEFISGSKNLLISIFEPEILMRLINESMTFQENGFKYINEIGSEKSAKYKPIISDIDFDCNVIREPLYGFKYGDCTLEDLKIKRNNSAKIEFDGEKFDKKASKLLPEDLASAIGDLWEIKEEEGRLRLFQEDSLFFIMSRLLHTEYPKENQLLLSMPTGGGKTEAFMIPILASIYLDKLKGNSRGIQSIIIYPTNALANDQAMRFVEMIYKVNKRLSENDIPKAKQITIGILSGDTPNKSSNLAKEALIRICPKCGNELKAREGELVCENMLESGEICDTRLDFCRLTKEDIVDRPPDILITNPDEINFALHSPKYLHIFKNKIHSIVFDEVHIYQGVFGCHIAHLLRRLEENMKYKPLYIGMSATIGNAKELAALLFDEPLVNIRYIRNENNKYQTDKIVKERYHVLVKPYLRGTATTKAGGERLKYIRTMSVAGSIGIFIGHIITDSHFRKSIIFTNYRSEADDLAGYLRERERLDVKEYFDTIIHKFHTHSSLTTEEIEICQYMNKWFEVISEKTNLINRSVEVGWNRGGLEKKERIRSIHSFSRNSLIADSDKKNSTPIDLMVATKSLEVGIDIGDVSTVINSSAPFTVNEYVQRVGRAGRKKDSLAITIINPENAIDSHLMNHFEEYVKHPEGSFEDAPIIINNSIVIRRHVEARIIDCITSKLLEQAPEINSVSLTINDLINKVVLPYDGKMVKLGVNNSDENALEFADALYNEIFSKKIENRCVLNRLLEFINRESTILETKKSVLSEEEFKKWIREIILEINSHLNTRSDKRWNLDKHLTGFDAVMPNLTPSLRGSGATVGLYIGDSDKSIDIVSRQTAFNSMPLSSSSAISTTKSGISTFQIQDDRGESDSKAEQLIRKKFREEEVLAFYKQKFDDFPRGEDLIEILSGLNVYVPNNLRVSYFPSRFYCEKCHKGLIPNEDCSETDNGVFCKTCGSKVQQLHKVYICENETCGQLFDPSVPKVCINPTCPTTIKAFNLYKSNGYSFKGKRKGILDLFNFRLTKDLEWVCMDCGCRINFASWKKLMHGNGTRVQRLIGNTVRNKETIEGFCSTARNFPEMGYFTKQYESYKCNIRDHKNRKTIGAPRVRTISYNYVGNMTNDGNEIELCSDINCSAAHICFNEGYVIQMANEYMRRFSSGTGDNESFTLKTEKILDNKYWSNYYESHLAWVKLTKLIDEFICDHQYTCEGDCVNCEKISSLDLGKMMRPRLALEDYNFDSVNGIPKKPDYRGRYCDLALHNQCYDQCCVRTDNGETCKNFSLDKFLRYVVVHTIKHGVLWALPKYAGVNASEIKAEIYPNDNSDKADFVMIDSNEGGSGALLLVEKHWDKIWRFADEIIYSTSKNEANIILPHTCSRYNADICPFITSEFFKFFNNNI